jgi:hypothetical protein
VKSAQEVYDEYRIMPGLQLHQLRVAAVAKLLCDNFERPIFGSDVTLACLFHDMGNIIKAELTTFPEFLEPEGLDYWKHVKSEYIAKYGNKAHDGNVGIAREIGLPPRVVELIDGISFSNIENVVTSGSWEQKICQYADDRAGPHGVVSISERLAEARSRYIDSGKSYYTKEGFDALSKSVYTLEQQIYSETRMKPEDITNAAVEPLVGELRNHPVA